MVPGISAYLLAPAKRHISVLDHVLDLAPHGDKQQHQPVQKEDWPEDWHVKYGEEGGNKAQKERLNRGVPACR